MKIVFISINVPQKLAGLLANNLDLDDDQAEVAYYGIELVWSLILNFFLITFLAVLTGTLLQAVIGGLTGAVLRLFAGGAHSNSPWRCALVGAVVLSAFGRLAIYLATVAAAILPYFMCLSTLAVLVVVWFLAPVDSPAKPITNLRKRRNLRALALGCVATMGIVEAILAYGHEQLASSLAFVMGMCLLWQGFSLTRLGHRVLGKLDGVLSLKKKEVS